MAPDASYSLVLIVGQDEASLSEMVKALRRAGHHTTGVSSFDEARRQILQDVPHMLVAQAHLGAHTGLHLALVGRALRPDFHAIIVGDEADPVLEADVVGSGAAFVVGPLSTDAIVRLMAVLIGNGAHAAIGTASFYWTAMEPRPERRTGDRRRLIMLGFQPERRIAQRRRTFLH